MNNNQGVLIGAIVVLVILIGGYFIWKSPATTPAPSTTTTTEVTDTTDTSGTVSTPVTGRTAGKPIIAAGAHAIVSSVGAIVNGTVTPNGSPTTYWYEYGKTSTLGSSLPPQTIGSGYL